MTKTKKKKCRKVFCNDLYNLYVEMSELPEKDISNVRSGVGMYYCKIRCRGLCLNYMRKISQTWWSSVGSILQ